MAKKKKKYGVVSVKFKLREDVTPRLKQVGMTMKSPSVVAIVQEGAERIAAEARSRAPRGPTGNLRAGIYTASTLRNGFRQLARRGRRRVNEPLKYVNHGTVLVVSSVFYGRWVEKGRQPRSKYDVLRRGEGAVKRTVGRQFATRKRGKPFLRPAVRAKKAEAEQLILRKLDALIETVMGKP